MLISNSSSSTSKLRVNCTKVHIIRLYFPAFPALPVLNIQLKFLFKNSIFYPHIIRNYTKRLNNIKNKNKSVTTNWRRPNHYKYNIWYGLGVKMHSANPSRQNCPNMYWNIGIGHILSTWSHFESFSKLWEEYNRIGCLSATFLSSRAQCAWPKIHIS